MGAFVDLTGRRFGRLLVKYRTDDYISPGGKRTAVWHCLCDCGNEVDVRKSSLTGGTQSCGCLQREKAEELAEDLTGKRFGRLLVIRRVDAKKIYSNGIKHAWLCRCDCGVEKVITAKGLKTQKIRSCGCLLSDTAKEKVSADGQNVLGRIDGTVLSAIKKDRLLNKNNKSGVKGVYYSTSEDRYIAQIGYKGKSIRLGRFKKFDDAVKARKKAEEIYYAPLWEKYEEQFNSSNEAYSG